MHRLIVALVAGTLLVFFSLAGSADAFKYRMRYGQAKNASLQYVRDLCADTPECIGYGTGQCYRRSLSRFDCTIGVFFPGAYADEEIECDQVLHWGVSYSGYVVLKNHGRPHCFSAPA